MKKIRPCIRESDVVICEKGNIVREFVKFEMHVRDFVNNDAFGIHGFSYRNDNQHSTFNIPRFLRTNLC